MVEKFESSDLVDLMLLLLVNPEGMNHRSAIAID